MWRILGGFWVGGDPGSSARPGASRDPVGVEAPRGVEDEERPLFEGNSSDEDPQIHPAMSDEEGACPEDRVGTVVGPTRPERLLEGRVGTATGTTRSDGSPESLTEKVVSRRPM